MNQTTNYNLNQWQRHDRVLMDDFNADNAIIDATLADHARQLEKLPFCGNCQIYTTTYQGDGTNSKNFGEDHPNTLTFPQKPAWVTIFAPTGRSSFNFFGEDMTYTYTPSNKEIKVCITWSGNTATWYANDVFAQMNWGYYTYRVIAFCPMD